MSASRMLLKSAERLKRAVTLAKVQAWWRELVEVFRALRRRFESYKPEAHYMRGPGPKFRQQHRPPPREIEERNEPGE
jgi:hypothetical protein